jgi:SNF2 family DNA or RNA helicase
MALPDEVSAEVAIEGATLSFDFESLRRLASDLGQGVCGTAAEREVRILAERLSLVDAFERLLALDRNRIDEYPHQIQTTLRVLREMRGRALLADEVGLGKTIEAGLILKEYLIRGMVRTVLILTPPSLVRQWQSEMEEKLDEQFELAAKPADWTRVDRVIGSLDTAKGERHAEQILSRAWDLVIVDEAHRLANNQTLAWKLVSRIRRRYLLLLTATPVQNDLRELYNLVTLIRPGQLGSYRGFRMQYVDPNDPRRPRQAQKLKELLGECMVRNRRSQVGITLPPRRAHVHKVRQSRGERELYEKVAALSRGRGAKGAETHGLLLLLQEACSSPDAAASTLRHLAGKQPALHPLAAEAELVTTCAKADTLARIARDVGEKILVFTEFRETQRRLKERLDEAGVETVLFHGGMSRDQRAEAVLRFHGEAPVMISTESGCEGQNLQFCHVLVNYDLPWNPMRLEQRIGRLHRLGQQREVHVFNLAAAGTIEADLLDLLANKIRMFELVVGELDLILGHAADESSFERELARIWLDSDDPRSYRQGLHALEARLAQARRSFDAFRAEEQSLEGLFG